MIVDRFNKIIASFQNLTEEKKILCIYRYASLVITSIAYFIGSTQHSMEKRIFIITCITMSSVILNYLYLINHHSKTVIKLLLFIEIIGNSVLLIPSGGLNSPYVWYALNTILISAMLLKREYCWINLCIYLFSSIWLSYRFFHQHTINIREFVNDEASLIVSTILITIAIQLLSKYMEKIQLEQRKLVKANTQLTLAKDKVKESINHIMELYQTVHLFSSSRSKNDLIELIIEYTKKITKAEKVIFYDLEKSERRVKGSTSAISDCTAEKLRRKVLEVWEDISHSQKPYEIKIEDQCFLFIPVASTYMAYGLLGIEVPAKTEKLNLQENHDQLVFIAGLSTMVLEKFELEQVNERLLVTEEQNRIANEIHDGVQQRLFSTSFGIYGLMKKLHGINIHEMDEDINMIRESIDHTMKELRTAIYGLSWKKNGTDNFLTDMIHYINEVRKLNQVEIDFNVLGNTESATSMQKRALYRIVCEGVGNAVRHGKASHIEVTLHMQTKMVLLKIEDNGSGFSVNTVKQSNESGLGVKNIYHLANTLNGKAYFRSRKGKGTMIKVIIPNQIAAMGEEKAI